MIWNPHNPMKHIWPVPVFPHSPLASGPTTFCTHLTSSHSSSDAGAPSFLSWCTFPGRLQFFLPVFSDHPEEPPLLFFYSSLVLTEHVLICLLRGMGICLRSTRPVDFSRSPLWSQNPAQNRYSRNVLNPFIDKEVEMKSCDLIPGINSRPINLGTTPCYSLSFFGSWSATSTAMSIICPASQDP